MKSTKWLLLVVFAPTLAHALDPRNYSTENEWNSPAQQSLGGIGSLSENHVDQFFADPSLAASAKPGFLVQWVGIHTAYSQDLFTTVSDFQKMADKSKGDNTDSTASALGMLDAISDVFGRRLTGNVNMNFLSFKIGGFSIIPYASALVSGEARLPSLPRAAVTADIYGGIGFGYAFNLGQKWDVGTNIRPGVRSYTRYQVDLSSVGDLSSSSQTSSSETSTKFGSIRNGLYAPVDLGVGFRPIPSLRTAIMMRDVGGAPALSVIGKDGTPPVYPMRLSLGVNWQILQAGTQEIRIGSELQDLLGLQGQSALWYRWQWAAQYRYRLPFRNLTSFTLNTGLQSGYPAWGIFIDLFIFKLEYARYTRESGYYIGQKSEARQSFRVWSQLAF